MSIPAFSGNDRRTKSLIATSSRLAAVLEGLLEDANKLALFLGGRARTDVVFGVHVVHVAVANLADEPVFGLVGELEGVVGDFDLRVLGGRGVSGGRHGNNKGLPKGCWKVAGRIAGRIAGRRSDGSVTILDK